MTALREGRTTGTCAAAAAGAAARLLAGGDMVTEIVVTLPDGRELAVPVASVHQDEHGVEAVVVKDAGDDPDVTDGARVIVRLEPLSEGDLIFRAGEGVGVVTKPGLAIKPGEPAVNPVPRRMIAAAIRRETPLPLTVTVSIPGGRELAEKTFNPRLGIEGGLSILGTSGRVRPFSHDALLASLRCTLDVFSATGETRPVLVPGHIGRRAALQRIGGTDERVIEVSNAWGFVLEEVAARGWGPVLLAGHPGKLAKLAMGHWDTHSSRSPSALPVCLEIASDLGWQPSDEPVTVEALLSDLPPDLRPPWAERMGERIAAAVQERFGLKTAVLLTDLSGQALGTHGDLAPWRI